MKKKIAVILSGCGVFDGAEIHEATLTLLSIKKNGYCYEIFAPNINQSEVVGHYSKVSSKETRNVLEESSRIARGHAKDLKDLQINDFEALIFPGGFGVTKNLCDFAYKGDAYSVIPEIENVILSFHERSKPIGAMCIAPILLAKVIKGSSVTVGNISDSSKAIEAVGSRHVVKAERDLEIDVKNKIVSTACYMSDADIVDIAESTDKLVKAIIELINK